MRVFMSIIVTLGMAIAAVVTFFAVCLIKAMTIAWTIFLMILGGLTVAFLVVGTAIHELFTGKGESE